MASEAPLADKMSCENVTGQEPLVCNYAAGRMARAEGFLSCQDWPFPEGATLEPLPRKEPLL